MRTLDIYKQIAGSKTPAISPAIQSIIDKSNQFSQSQGQLASDPTITANPALMQTTFQSDTTNFWNSFMNSIDEIHKSSAQGKQLPYQRNIDRLSKEIEELANDPKLEEQERQGLLQAKESELKSVMSDPEYLGLQEDAAEQQADIDESPIDLDYQMQQDMALPEENTDFYKYIKYKLPKELGGSASEMDTQLMVALGQGGMRMLATMAAATAIGGPIAPAIMAGAGLASTIGGLVSLYQMRESESDAEVNDAFEQRVQQDVEALDHEPSESELRDIRLNAYEGLDQLKAQNMNLMLGDAMDVMLLALPWSKNIAKLTGATRGTRLAKNVFAGIAGAYNEGMEETDQYGATQQYLAGKYKDNVGVWDSLKESANLRKDSFDYVITGETGEGYEKDAEYRNAFRSGAILGGLMGGASSVASAVGDENTYRNTANDIKSLSPALLDKTKVGYRADLYTKYFGSDSGQFLLEGLNNLKETLQEPEQIASINEEIQKAKEASSLYDTIKNNNKHLGAQDINKAYKEIYNLKGNIDDFRDKNNQNEIKYAEEQVKLNSIIGDPILQEAVRKKAKIQSIDDRLNLYYAMDSPPSNIQDYEKQLEEDYKNETTSYNDYLNTNNLSPSEVNYVGLADLAKRETSRTDSQFAIRELQTRLNQLQSKGGIKQLLDGKLTPKKVADKPAFDIETTDLAGYEDYEKRNLARRKFQTKLENYKRELFESNLATRLGKEDLTTVLDDISKEIPSLSDDSIKSLTNKINERKTKGEEDRKKAEELQTEGEFVRDLDDTEKLFVQETLSKDETPFNTAADRFNEVLPQVRTKKSMSDDAVRRSIADDFTKGADAVVDHFEKNPDYGKIADVRREISRLEKLKAIKTQRTEVLTKAEFADFQDNIDAKITKLREIEKIVEQRLQDITKKDATTFDNQSELVLPQLGSSNVQAKIKAIIGETKFNDILEDAKESNLTYLGVDTIKYLLANGIGTRKKELLDVIETEKQSIYDSILAIKRVEIQSAGKGNLEKYVQNPEGVFNSIVNSIKENPGFDAERTSSIYQYEKDRNLINLLSNAKAQDRGKSATTKDDLVNLVTYHIQYLGLTNLEKALDSTFNIEGEVEAELATEKEVRPSNSLYTPSNQQLVSIRQLVNFFHTKEENKAFSNTAYLKGYAGTGKTTVVLPWVLRLLGLSKDNVLAVGHNTHSAEGIGRSLGTDTNRTIENLLTDFPTSVPDNIKLVVIDEIGAVNEDTLNNLGEWMYTVNENRKEPVKIVVMGDPNQISTGGFYAPIEIQGGAVWGLETLTHINPLTTPYRSNVAPIVDVQDLFMDQPNNITNTPIYVQANTDNPTSFSGDLIGVSGGDFDNVIPILANRPNDNRSRALIVNNANDVDAYTNLLNEAGIKGVEVVTYIDAQGRTIDEVYVNVKKDKIFGSNREYNTALYTALSRATKYIYLGGIPTNNAVSPNIEDNAKAREQSILQNSKKFLDNRKTESVFLSQHLDTIVAKEPVKETPQAIKIEVPEEAEIEEEVEELEVNLDNTRQLNEQDNNTGSTTRIEESRIAESEGVHVLQYPTYASIRTKGKDGIDAGDKAYYVKTLSKNGQPRIQIVSPVEGKVGFYREVGMLSEEELNNPPVGLESTFAILKDAFTDANADIDSFDEADGLLRENGILSILADGTIAHTQRLKYKYKKKGKPLNLRNTVKKFIDSYYKGKPVDEEQIYRNAKVRVYSKNEVGEIEKNSNGNFTPIAGIPYLELSNLGTNTHAKQYIRLSPAKLNEDKHKHLVQPLQEFVDKFELLTNLLTEAFITPNQALIARIVRSTDEEVEKLLSKMTTDPISFDRVHQLRKEIDDLVYDKKVTTDKDGNETTHRSDGKAQRAFNILAKSNLEVDGQVLRVFKSYTETKEGKASITQRFDGKRLLPKSDTPYTPEIGNQYAARYLKQKGREVNQASFDALTEEERQLIVDGVTESISLDRLKSLLSFDEKGNSNVKGGFGLRVPLFKPQFKASGTTVKLEEYIEDTFDAVEPTSISIAFAKSARIERSTDTIDDSIISNEERKTIEDAEDMFFMLKDDEEDLGTLLTNKQARAYAKQLIPSIKPEEVQILDEIEMLRLTEGTKAWGFYKKGLIYLENTKGIPSKVIRHEVFHRIFNYHLTNAERKSLLAIARRDYPELRIKSDGEVDEVLARKYQDWKSGKGQFTMGIVNFFKKILAKLGFINTNIKSIDKLFRDIDAGLFTKPSSEPLNVGRPLVKIIKHYGDTQTYVKARNFAIYTLSGFINNTTAIEADGSNLIDTVPLTFNEAVEKLKKTVKNRLLELEKQPDNDKKRTALAVYSSLVQTNAKGEYYVLEELMSDIYPNIFSKEAFGETIPESDEEIAAMIEGSEVNGIYEHIEEGDRVDHEDKISRKVKDILSTIITTDKKLVNPRFAYFKLLQTIPGLDFSDFQKLDKQLQAAFGEQRNTNVNVGAIYNKLQQLIKDASPNTLHNKKLLRKDMEFTDENTLQADGVTIKRGNLPTAAFFKKIKDQLEKNNVGVDYQELKLLYKRKQAQETLAAIRSSIGSLREKQIMIAEQHNTKKVKDADGSSKELFVTTYRYVTVGDAGIKKAVDSDIREAITNNYTKLDSVKGLIEQADSKETKSLAIKTFYETIGIKETLDIPSNAIFDTHESIKNFMKDLSTIGKEMGKELNENGEEETTTYGIEDVLNDSNQRIDKLVDILISNSQDVRPASYRAADGKKRYMFMNSSNAIDTLRALTTPHLADNKPAFLSSERFKNNIFVNGINKVLRIVDHDGNKDMDDRRDAILYKDETELDWYSRNINSAFGAMVKHARGNKYVQYFYTISNKPNIVGAEVNILNQEQIKEAIKQAEEQEATREDLAIGNYGKDKSFIGKDAYARMEKIADELTDKLIEMQFPVDFDLATIHGNLKEFMTEEHAKAEIPSGIRSKLNQQYQVKKEWLLPVVDVFVKNYYINGHFLNQLVMGDQAFYKSTEDEIKRMSIAFGIGYTGLVNAQGWMRPNFRIAVANDLQGTLGAYFDEFNKINPRSFDSTDAGGFMTPERYEEVKKGFSADMHLGVTMKPVYFGIDDDGIPRAVKYSSIVLTDSLVEKFPKLGALRDDMRKNNVDEYTFKSAFKVGAPKALSEHDEETGERLAINPDSIVTLSNKNWRIQLNPVHSVDSQTAHPTQLTYFINFNGNNKEAANELYDINAKLIRNGLANVIEDLKLGTDEMEKAIRSKVSSSMGDTDARQKEFLDAKVNGKSAISLNFPTLVNKVITQTASLFTKATVAIKYPGSKLVLQPDYLIDITDEMKTISRRLKFRTDIKLVNGETREYAEVIMPNMFKGQIKQGELLYNTFLGFRVPSTELHSAIPLKVVGFYDDKGSNVIIAPQEIVLFHGSDYDIDSLFIMRRKEWNKDTIDGIVTKGELIGYKDGKFDTEFIPSLESKLEQLRKDLAQASQKGQKSKYKSIYEEYRTISEIYDHALKNRAVDIFLEVITDPKNKEAMMTPITTGRIDDTEGRYGESVFEMIQNLTGKLKEKADLNNPIDQARIHSANFSGTALVGGNADAVKALAYIFQSITEGELPLVDDKFVLELNGTKYDHLSRIEYAERNEQGEPVHLEIQVGEGITHNPLISETMDALINAAVDNVKLQILPIINMSNNTGKAWSAMIGMGIPLKTVTKFMITPVIKQVSTVKGMDRAIRTSMANLKAQLTALELPEDFDIESASAIDITDEVLENIIKNPDTKESIIAQYRVLKMFKTASDLGEKIGKFSSAAKVLQTLPVTYEEIQDKQQVFQDIADDSGFKNIDIMKVPHIKEAKGILDILADTIKSIAYKHNDNLVAFSNRVASFSNITLDRKGGSKNKRAIRDEFVKYIMSSISYEADGERFNFSTINEEPYEIANKKYKAVGTDAWNQRFILQVIEAKRNNKNNEFLRNLEISTNYRTGLKFLRYSAASTAKQEDILDYQEAFKALGEPNKYSALQRDFVKYAALNFGLSFGSSNYSLLLPPDIYAGLSQELDKKFKKLLEGNEEEVKAKLDNVHNHFTMQMAINNVDKVGFNSSNVKSSNNKDYGVDEVGSTKVMYGLRYASEIDGKEVDLPFIVKSFKKVFVKLPKILEGKQEYVYYQEIGKQPSNTHYQLDNRVINFGYDYTKAFRPDVIVRTLDNNKVEEYISHSDLGLGVGDTLALRNYSDITRMDMIDYKIAEIINNEDETITYKLSNPKRVFEASIGNMSTDEFKESNQFENPLC